MSNKVSVEIDAKVSGFQKGMKDASDSMKQYETDTRKISESTVNFKKELGQARREAMNLAAGYAKLSQEAKNSEFGKEMKRQLDAAKESAAELIDLQGDVSQELKNMANDTRMLSTLGEGVGLIGDAFAATTGIIAQFTGSEEDAKRAVVAFTTAQSALGAVTKLQNALQKQSNIMLAVAKVQTMAATAAENAKTEATIAGTVAQKAMNAVAKANPYVLLATAVIGVTAAIWGFIKVTKTEETELQKLNRIALDVHNTSLQGQKDAQADVVKLDLLYKATQNVNLSMKDRKQAAQKLIDQYPGYFSNMSTEQIMLGKASEKYQQLRNDIIAVAIAKAYEQKITEKASELVDVEDELEKAEKELKIAERAAHTYDNAATQFAHGAGQINMTMTSAKKNSDAYDVAANKVSNLKKKQEELNTSLEKYSDKSLELQKNVNRLEAGTTKPDKPTKGGGGGSKTEKTDEQELQTHIQALIQLYIKLDKTEGEEAENERKRIRSLIAEDKKRLNQLQLLKEQAQGKLLGGDISMDIAPDFKGFAAAQTSFEKGFKGLSKDVLPKILSPLQQIQYEIDRTKQLMELAPNKDIYQILKQHLEELEKTQAEFKGEDIANNTAKSWQTAASAISSASGAISSFEDPGAKIAGIIGQAVATIALAYAETLGKDKESKSNIWLFIASAAAAMASMITSISSIHSATGYAEGGIVGGSSYAGDRINARLNSGEMVLNKRQQRNLFNLLDTSAMPQSGGSVVQVQGVIHGTDLLLVQKNTNKVRGRAGTSINF